MPDSVTVLIVFAAVGLALCFVLAITGTALGCYYTFHLSEKLLPAIPDNSEA